MHLARTSQPEEPPSDDALVAVVSPPAPLPATTGFELLFSDMYQRAHDRAMSHASRFVPYDDAREAVQLAAVELWEQWTKLKPEEHTEAFFIGTVHNRVLRRLRQQEHFVELTDELEESPEFIYRVTGVSPEGEIDLRPLIDGIVAAMPLRCREVFLLVREQRCSYEQVAERLGITLRTAYNHMTRANQYIIKGCSQAGIVITEGTVRRLLPAHTSEASDE